MDSNKEKAKEKRPEVNDTEQNLSPKHSANKRTDRAD